MKIYINSAKEDWIVDRFKYEWNKYNFKVKKTEKFMSEGVIWIIAPWTWRKISSNALNKNKVLCTIHHIDDTKFNDEAKREFDQRDGYIDKYHVISSDTYEKMKSMTNKPVQKIPFWVNQNLWFKLDNPVNIRKKYNFDSSLYLIGSFQRDTEGIDLKSPKLSKGPDRFLEIVINLNKIKDNLVVVLTGKRRNYLIENFKKNKINYRYFEMASLPQINELYNILDLYIVSSRTEGGPQAVVEAAITKTPIISTDVGIAKEILSNESIYDMNNYMVANPNIEYAYKNSLDLTIPNGFEKFNKMIDNLYEN